MHDVIVPVSEEKYRDSRRRDLDRRSLDTSHIKTLTYFAEDALRTDKTFEALAQECGAIDSEARHDETLSLLKHMGPGTRLPTASSILIFQIFDELPF